MGVKRVVTIRVTKVFWAEFSATGKEPNRHQHQFFSQLSKILR